MKRFTAEEVLSLSPQGELTSLLRASEVNLTEILRLFSGQPGAWFYQDDRGVRFLNRNLPPESMVLMTRWPAADVEDYIGAELRRFEEYGVAVDWYLFPPSSPTDLPVRLQQRGLVPGSTRWLLTELATLPSPPSMPSNFRLEVAESSLSMDAWRRASAAGFGMSEASAQRYHDAYVGQPRSSENVELRIHYVGYVNDVPVSSSTLLLAGGIACMWDVSTAPEHRRKGYGSCLTRVGLDDARRKGYRYASLNSSSRGYSVYRSLGFNVEFAIPEYHWTPRRTRGI
jgi:ribosomal protein S18 acetylase RimI-like enzyme